MPIIYCTINIFDYEQEVFSGDGKRIGRAPLKDLPKFIVEHCKESDVHKVCLNGLSAYTKEVRDKINTYNKTKYEDFEIEVEVNE